jgi:L-fuculose-phosphate aldolase
MNPTERELRAQAAAAVHRLDALGLNRGSTGNLSVRWRDGCLITPTGMEASELQAQDLVWLGEDGSSIDGDWQPSSEWHIHSAIYEARDDVQAVVHAHPVHATALACLERPLPAFHYMVAIAGGEDIPCAPYHLFGTQELSTAVVARLHARNACLMAHHGLVAVGTTLGQAVRILVEVEWLCETYLRILSVDAQPRLLSTAQMAAVIERFKSYGKMARSPEPHPPAPVQRRRPAPR